MLDQSRDHAAELFAVKPRKPHAVHTFGDRLDVCPRLFGFKAKRIDFLEQFRKFRANLRGLWEAPFPSALAQGGDNRNKLAIRGFDKAINIWGADHHGHVARLQAALDGLGLDGSHRLVIVLMQLVNLMQDGKPVRMSKRSGKAIALHDLLDEISVDAARYFFNSRASTSPLDFDLDLAVREDSENPVY